MIRRVDPASATLVRRSCVKRYTRRWSRLERAEEIKRAGRRRDYASAEAELAARADVLGWAAGDGPKVIFAGAVTWLREPWLLLSRGDHAGAAGAPGAGAGLTRRRFSSRIRRARF
jgi:hypothetical protein